MAGLAILSGLRRGELFALRWRDIDEQARLLTVREAVYDGVFATPKTEAGSRQIPLSDAALTLIAEWKAHVGSTEPHALCSRRVPAHRFCRTTSCADSSSRRARGWDFLEQPG
jgi:integrase